MVKKIDEQIIDQVKNPVKKKKIKRPRLLTGSTLRDSVLGGAKGIYGIQAGVIWNLIGVSGGGKTFHATEMIAVNRSIYKDKFKWHYDDAEGGNEVDSKKLYGFDIKQGSLLKEKDENNNEVPVISKTVQQLHMNIKKFVNKMKKDDIGIYVSDSLDALISDEIKKIIEERKKAHDKGDEYDEGSYLMQKAKYLKQQLFPDIKPLIEASNVLLIIISQQSEKIGITYGSTKDRAGGKALRFFSHFESWVRELQKIEITIKGETRAIGIRNIEKFTKTRNPRPFRECITTIYFDYGISDIDSNVDFVFNMLTDGGKDKAKDSSKIRYKDCIPFFSKKEDFFNIFKKKHILKKELEKIDEIKEDDSIWWISKNDLIEHIEENNLEELLKQMTIDKWESIEDAILIKRKKKY